MTAMTLFARILFLLYLAAIGMLCWMHVDKMPDLQKTLLGFPTDKVAHFLMFLPFPILAYLAFDHKNGKAGRAFLFAFLALFSGAAVAGLTEWVQSFLPYRTLDMADFKADLLALGLSTFFVLMVDLTHLNKRN